MQVSQHILVTGAAGFIGSFVARQLLDAGYAVVGLDNLSAFYDVQLKKDRLQALQSFNRFQFYQIDLADTQGISDLFQRFDFQYVLHIGAQAGVRYSITNPHTYSQSNLVGFLNILEGCRSQSIEHLIFASSSSVYGANTLYPLSEHHAVDHPVSLYAATKKSNEVMAHSYAHLYGIPCTGLRFFTVYGPWGRPDMALFKFVHNIIKDQPIQLFNYGRMSRDFTYIDDIVEGILRLMPQPPQPDPTWSGQAPNPATSYTQYRVYNIGHGQPVSLQDFVQAIESKLGITAKKDYLPMQMGDVPKTYADTTALYQAVGYQPQVAIENGVSQFIDWYMHYYNVQLTK